MSSSAINQSVFSAKVSNIQNAADTSSIYSAGAWDFKNASAVTSVKIDASGNVGVGATPSAWASGYKAIELGNGNGWMAAASGLSQSFFTANSYFDGANWKYKNAGPAQQMVLDAGNGITVFSGASSGSAGANLTWSERMRIDASGNLLVGATGANVGRIVSKGIGDGYPAFRAETNLTTSQQQISFVNPNGIVGTITSSGTATAYNTGASDYRLKEQVQALSGGLNKIKSLRPVSFVWKADQRQDIGFIAHEVQPVIPECVSGEKDGVDAEGNPSYQSIFPAPAQMIANLVAAIQELSAKNDALEARLAALEAKP